MGPPGPPLPPKAPGGPPGPGLLGRGPPGGGGGAPLRASYMGEAGPPWGGGCIRRGSKGAMLGFLISGAPGASPPPPAPLEGGGEAAGGPNDWFSGDLDRFGPRVMLGGGSPGDWRGGVGFEGGDVRPSRDPMALAVIPTGLACACTGGPRGSVRPEVGRDPALSSPLCLSCSSG